VGFHPHLVKIQSSGIPDDREGMAQRRGPNGHKKEKNICKVVSKYNVELHYHVACRTYRVLVFGRETNFKLKKNLL